MKTLRVLAAGLLAYSSAFAIDSTKQPDQRPKIEEKKAVAREVVHALTVQELDEAAFRESMIERIDRDLPKMKLGDEAKKQFREALIATLMGVTNERLLELFAQPYEDEFTIEELRAIRDFYQSEAGKALLRKQEAVQRAQEDGKRALTEQLLEETGRRLRDAQEQGDQ